MRRGARSVVPGKVRDVVKGATTSHVVVRVAGGVAITAAITNEAVEELRLQKGDSVCAVVEASDVMVGED